MLPLQLICDDLHINLRSFLFHRPCKGYASDSAGEEIAASDVARDVAMENDGSAERALEFVENSCFEDGGLLPVLSALNAKQSFLPAVAFQSRVQWSS